MGLLVERRPMRGGSPPRASDWMGAGLGGPNRAHLGPADSPWWGLALGSEFGTYMGLLPPGMAHLVGCMFKSEFNHYKFIKIILIH